MIDRRLLQRSSAARRAVGASVALGLVSTVSVVVQAVALARILAGAMPGGHPAGRTGALVVLAGAAALRGGVSLVGALVAQRGSSAVKHHLRTTLLDAAVLAPSDSSEGAGSLATLAGRGLDSLDVYVGRCLPDMVLAVVAPLVLVVAVGVLDWLSALVVLVALALFPLFGALVGRTSMSLAGSRWAQLEALGRQVEDVFCGLPVLKAFGRSAEQRRRIDAASEALRRASLGTLRLAFLSALVLDTLASVSVALVAVPLGLRLVDGSVSLPAALAVLIVAPEVFLPFRRASAEFHESTEGLAALDRLWRLTGAVPPAGAGPGPVAARPVPDPGDVAVELRGLHLAYPDRERPVLDGVDLRIGPGETVVLVGPNGAGKSSILALLLGFASPTAGTVVVGDTPLEQLGPDEWRRHLAYLPEHPGLIAGSLADNLRLADPGAGDDRLLEALAAVGAASLVHDLDGGLHGPLGRGGRALSAGERQRVALARTVLRPASLYLLDEPTVHLDPGAERRVVAALDRTLRGRSALVVTHSPPVLELADRVVALEAGRLVPWSGRPGDGVPPAGGDAASGAMRRRPGVAAPVPAPVPG